MDPILCFQMVTQLSQYHLLKSYFYLSALRCYHHYILNFHKDLGLYTRLSLLFHWPASVCSVTQSCLTPWTSVHGILRQEYWSGVPFPPLGGLPERGLVPHLWCLLHWQLDLHCATWEAPLTGLSVYLCIHSMLIYS